MSNSLACLRHHAIIGRHHQHNNVSNLSATRPHGREGFVAWGVQEDNLALGRLDLIGTDMLRDTAGLGGLDICRPNSVEQ